ncbi:MAG: carboxypeptidase regulatory-like domain-containing protein, partial [Acidobacteriota bacterium]
MSCTQSRSLLRSLAFLAMVLWGASLLAQGGTGQIAGTVRDEQGGVIPGVAVTLRNVETGVTRVSVTEADGRYRFPSLLPGEYEVKAELAGFQTVEIRGDLIIRIGLEITRDITMPIGTVTETITVTGESLLVETSSIEVSGVVSQEQISDLPIDSRNYLSLALLMPGTTLDGTRSFFPTINVGGAVAFNATGNILDGTINNWVEDGEPRQNLPEDAVEEFKVSNAQFDAEYGLATAGLVQIVTKSGTNTFHGTGFEYFRDKSLNALGVFESEKPEFRRDQFGGSIGGPVVQDKMHFFSAVERTQVNKFYTVFTGLPDFYGTHE